MLSFKQFLKGVYLVEATARHFPFLDPTNQHHQDLVAAYNTAHSANDPLVKRHPGQIKSIAQLELEVKLHLDKIHQERRHATDDKEAWDRGDVKLIHHNTRTGFKIYQPFNQPGVMAALSDIGGKRPIWCTGKRDAGADMVHHYDKPKHQGGPSMRSFIFHDPSSKNKDHRIIGSFGEFKEGLNNFNGVGNTEVQHDDWSEYIKKHGLDDIKELWGKVRGISLSDANKEKYQNELSDKIKIGNINPKDFNHAIENNYLTDEHEKNFISNKNISSDTLDTLIVHPALHKLIISHPNASENTLRTIASDTKDPDVHKMMIVKSNVSNIVLHRIARNTSDPEVHKAIIAKPTINDDILNAIAYNTSDPEVHKAIIYHPKADGDVLESVSDNTDDLEVKKLLAKRLEKIKH